MSDSFSKQVEQWIASAITVEKGGSGSGRYPAGSGGGYTTGDLEMSATSQPNAIEYGNTNEIEQAANEHIQLQQECAAKSKDESLPRQVQLAYGQAALNHSMANHFARRAAEALADDKGAETDRISSQTHSAIIHAIDASEQAAQSTVDAIILHAKFDPTELPEQWEGMDIVKQGRKVRKGGAGSGRFPKGTSQGTSETGKQGYTRSNTPKTSTMTSADHADEAKRLESEFNRLVHHESGKTAEGHARLASLASKIADHYEAAAKQSSRNYGNDYNTMKKQAEGWRERAYRLSTLDHTVRHEESKSMSYNKSVNPLTIESLLAEADKLEERAVELAEEGLLDAAADYCREAADCFDVIVEAFKPEGNGEVIGEAALFAENLRASADALLRLRDEHSRPSNEFNKGFVRKGGAGSGEHDGHPFRGNRFTVGSAEKQAMYHDVRSGTENFHHGEHLDAADAHVKAGEAAMKAGEFGVARSHFNEAAYHASQATHQLRDPNYPTTNKKLADHANELYYRAHKAGDAAQKASKSTNAVGRHERRGGLVQRLASRLGSTGRHLRATASAHKSDAQSHATGVVRHNEKTQGVRRTTGDPTVSARQPRMRSTYRRANAPTSASDDVYRLSPRRRA